MRIIAYRLHHPPSSRTAFATLEPRDRSWLCEQIVEFITAITETSSSPNSDPWLSVITQNQQLWGRSKRYPGVNTLLSVLSGCYRKLQTSTDLSVRQIEMLNYIGRISDQLSTPEYTFEQFRFQPSV